jgi:hypothetical protein
MQQAKGTFEVKRSMEPAVDLGDGVEGGHFRFDKTFEGRSRPPASCTCSR